MTDPLKDCAARWKDAVPLTDHQLVARLESPSRNDIDRLVAEVLRLREERDSTHKRLSILGRELGTVANAGAAWMAECGGARRMIREVVTERDRLHTLIAAGHTHHFYPMNCDNRDVIRCVSCDAEWQWPADAPDPDEVPRGTERPR